MAIAAATQSAIFISTYAAGSADNFLPSPRANCPCAGFRRTIDAVMQTHALIGIFMRCAKRAHLGM